MTLTESIERVRRENLDWCETIYATSDGHFFLNSTPSHIIKHAEEMGLEIYSIKGPALVIPEPKEIEPKHSKDKK